MATPVIPMGQAGFSGPVPFNYYPLLSDGDDIVSRPASIASGGGVFKRGAIVKWDPATGLVTLPAAATDCNAILVNDVDATSAAQAAQVYVGGKFKADAVIWPGALSHALVTESLRQHDMQIESVEFTDGSLVKGTPSEAQAAEAQKQVEANRSQAIKAAEPPPEQKPSSDSPWGYLTAEEREKRPQLAQVAKEDEGGEGDDKPPEEKPQPKTTHTPPHAPPQATPAPHTPHAPAYQPPHKKREE